MKGRLDGTSLRVPVPTGSITDFVANLKKPATVDEINAAFRAAASGPLKGVLEYNRDPLVSSDFNHDSASSTYEASYTKVTNGGLLLKVLSWYDNEWGFSNRMLDTTVALMSAQ